MKIAICEFSHEANSFTPELADFARFAPNGWEEPDVLLDMYRGTQSFLGGMIHVAEEAGVDLLPLPTVRDCACPVLQRNVYEHIIDRICSHLAAHKDGLNGICFSLHGAGMAEGIDDVELATVNSLRSVVGEEIPIVCTADLHGNISHEFLSRIQGLFCHKENPHTDNRVSGEQAMTALIALLRGQLHPRMHLCQLPLLTTPATGSTLDGPMREIKDFFTSYREQHRLIDAAFFHGFSASDHPGSMASVLVMADGYDPAEHAEYLADYVWSLRKRMIPESLTPEQAIDQALAQIRDGYVVINEFSDNVGAGCPGDGTHLLRALLERDVPRSIFEYIYDPEVAQQAHVAGVGATISIRLGGKTDPIAGDPIVLDQVQVLSTPQAESHPYTSPMHLGLDCPLGKTARLRHGNVEFIVVSLRKQTKDDGAITMTGADIRDYQLVCLKSANHFRSFFASRADAIVTADPPGLRADPRSYPYTRVSRPIYPLDPDTKFF